MECSKEDERACMIGCRNVRKEVWDAMESKEALVNYRPIYKRIPYFKGSDLCVENLMELEEVKQAQVIYSDIDKPLLPSIHHLLKSQKHVMIPEFRSKVGFLRKLTAVDKDICYNSNDIKQILLYKNSVVVGYDKIPHIDVLLLSSVIVSLNGKRVGDDGILSGILYPVLAGLGAVDERTLVVTIVHDLQVVSSTEDDTDLDNHVPADVVITPTQLYRIGQNAREKRQSTIDWTTKSQDVIDRHHWLTYIRNRDLGIVEPIDEKSTEESEIKNDSDTANQITKSSKNSHRRRRYKQTYRTTKETGYKSSTGEMKYADASIKSSDDSVTRNVESGFNSSNMEDDGFGKDKATSSKPKSRRSRQRHGRRSRHSRKSSEKFGNVLDSKSTGDVTSQKQRNDNKNDSEQEKRSEGRGTEVSKKSSRHSIRGGVRDLPCLYLSGFSRTLRYWQVKRMVLDCDVYPLFITRIPYTGYAFLYFETIEDVNKAKEAFAELMHDNKQIRVEVGNRHRTGKVEQEQNVEQQESHDGKQSSEASVGQTDNESKTEPEQQGKQQAQEQGLERLVEQKPEQQGNDNQGLGNEKQKQENEKMEKVKEQEETEEKKQWGSDQSELDVEQQKPQGVDE